MNTIVSFEQVPNMVWQILEKVNRWDNSFTKPVKPQLQQRFDFDGALNYLNEMGYTISTSKLQKLCADKKIPVCKFNNRLVFERTEIDAWVKSQTIAVCDNSCAALTLSKSASRKLRRS